MIGKIGVGAGHGIAADQVFGLELLPIGGEDELDLEPGGGGAGLEGGEGCRDFTRRAGDDVDIVALQDAAQIGSVGIALAQLLDLGRLAPEGLQKGIGEFGSIKRRLGQIGNCLFNLDRVHLPVPSPQR